MRFIITFLLLFFSTTILKGEITVFTDDFNNTSYISVISNVTITNSMAVLSNVNFDGVLYSSIISKKTNEVWNYLIIDYEKTNTGSTAPDINFDICDTNGSILIANLTNHTVQLSVFAEIKDRNKIKIKADFIKGIGVTKGSVLLKKWSVSVNVKSTISEAYPDYSDKFYAAPTPFKISDNKIRFYYLFSENSIVSLDIYDVNYILVKSICSDKNYSAGSYLNETWNGKNGNGVSVYSGLYIAKLTVKDSNKNIKSTLIFPFAVIK